MRNLKLIGILAALSVSAAAKGDTLYWDGSGLSWNDEESWSTVESGVDPLTAQDATYDPAAVPGAADDVVFGADTVTENQSLHLSAVSQAARSISFTNTTGLTYSIRRSTGTGGSNLITVGEGGVTAAAGAGTITIGNSSSTAAIRFAASQTWTSFSSNSLTIRNNAAVSDDVTTPIVWTVNAAGSGNIGNSGALNDSTTGGTVEVIVASTGTGTVSLNGGNWSGGTTVKSGRLQTDNIGGLVRLGDTEGSADATIIYAGAAIATGTLIVQDGNSGVMMIDGNTTATIGEVILNKDVTIDNDNVFTFNGPISGVGSITKSDGGTIEFRGANTYSGDTLVDSGTLNVSNVATNGESTGSMRFVVTDGGSNRIYGNGGTANAIIDGTFVLDLSSVTVSTGAWELLDTVTLTETFGENFSVVDQAGALTFTESAGLWTSNDSNWTFDESTGTLAAVPEPASLSLLVLGAAGLLRRRRREG